MFDRNLWRFEHFTELYRLPTAKGSTLASAAKISLYDFSLVWQNVEVRVWWTANVSWCYRGTRKFFMPLLSLCESQSGPWLARSCQRFGAKFSGDSADSCKFYPRSTKRPIRNKFALISLTVLKMAVKSVPESNRLAFFVNDLSSLKSHSQNSK